MSRARVRHPPGPAWLVSVLLLGTLPAGAAAWLTESSACLDSLAGAEDRAAALADVCPATTTALAADAVWGELLTVPVAELPAGSLAELAELARGYRQPAAGPRLDGRTLDRVLAALPEREAAGLSVGERLRAWLADWLESAEGGWPDWLDELSLPASWSEGLWYALVGLIVLLAVAGVANELRLRPRRKASAGAMARRRAEPRTAGGIESLSGLAPREQLAGLVHLVVTRLQDRELLPRRPGLTHREIGTRAGVPPDQLVPIAALCAAAERARFGDWSPRPEDLDGHVRACGALLSALSGEQR